MGTEAMSPSTACRAPSGRARSETFCRTYPAAGGQASADYIRPLAGVKPLDSTKGRGMMAWGYLLLHRSTGVADYWTKAVECLHWLDVRRSPKFEKHSWANSFDFSSRGGAYHKDDSIIVWTSLIAQHTRGFRAVTGPVVSRYRLECVRLDHVATTRADRSRQLPQLFRTWSGIDP